MIWFVLYSLLFIALAYIDFRKGQTPAGYFLNDRKSKTHQVGFSIIASCVGGSATVGMCGLAYAVGTPALWWLLSGAAGLVVLRLFMVPRIRSRGSALTMPEMIRESVGVHAHRLSCVIILCSWVAILAAQFLAMGRIVSGLTGMSSLSAMACGAFVIVLYTWLGGQASVIKSDVIQLVCLATGLIFLLGFLISINPEPVSEVRLEWLNDKFEISDWSRFMLLIGGSYIVCPMLFARIMSAESDKAPRSGAGHPGHCPDCFCDRGHRLGGKSLFGRRGGGRRRAASIGRTVADLGGRALFLCDGKRHLVFGRFLSDHGGDGGGQRHSEGAEREGLTEVDSCHFRGGLCSCRFRQERAGTASGGQHDIYLCGGLSDFRDAGGRKKTQCCGGAHDDCNGGQSGSGKRTHEL